MWNDIKLKESSESYDTFDTCENCGFILLEKEPICPSGGHEQDQNKGEKNTNEKQVDTELVELTGGYNNIRGRMISSLNMKELKTYIDYTGNINFAIRVARSQGDNFLISFVTSQNFKK